MIKRFNIPELWRICSSKSITEFLDKNNTKFKPNDTGKGKNRGKEKCDYLATKDGWMLYSLEERKKTEIITEDEYNYAIKCYETIRENLSDKEWNKIKLDKNKYLIRENNFQIPILDYNINNYNNLSITTKNIHICILDLQKEKKGLITYNTLSNYYQYKYSQKLLPNNVSKRVKDLYKFYYNRDGLSSNF